jgi:hypothetical protein
MPTSGVSPLYPNLETILLLLHYDGKPYFIHSFNHSTYHRLPLRFFIAYFKHSSLETPNTPHSFNFFARDIMYKANQYTEGSHVREIPNAWSRSRHNVGSTLALTWRFCCLYHVRCECSTCIRIRVCAFFVHYSFLTLSFFYMYLWNIP